MLLEDGKYIATLNGGVVIYNAESGALCVALPVRVRDGEKAGTDMKHTMTLVNKDGEIKENNIATLRTVFGWDSADPFWLTDNSVDGGPMRAVAFEIVVLNEQVTDNFGVTSTVSKIQWINPEGGRGVKMPAMADRRAVLAKYGAMFRATAPAAKPQAVAQPAAAAPAVPANVRPLVLKPAPIGGGSATGNRPAAVPTVTVDDAWKRYVQAYGNTAEQKWGDALHALNITGEPTAADCAILIARVNGDDDVPFEQPAAAVAVPTLDDGTVAKLEAAIGANGPAVGAWLVGMKWLGPGQGLQHLTAEKAGQILSRPAAFLRAVKGGAA
jgi:hypothetical protein